MLWRVGLPSFQWWNVTKYIYSRVILPYNSGRYTIRILYTSISFSCHFIQLLYGNLEKDTALYVTYNT